MKQESVTRYVFRITVTLLLIAVIVGAALAFVNKLTKPVIQKADEEKMKKFDKVYNVFLIGACIAFAGFLIWKIVDTFFLK